MSKLRKPAVSISGDAYARLAAYAKEHGDPVTVVLEQVLTAEMDRADAELELRAAARVYLSGIGEALL